MAIRNPGRPVVAVYSSTFLALTMTFVYRQLMGISECFSPIVLTTRSANRDAFPFDPVYEAPAHSDVLHRLLRKARRIVKQQHWSTTFEQFTAWKTACTTNNVSLIHAHFGDGGLEMLPLGRALKIPLLVTFHGYDASEYLRNRIYAKNLKALMKLKKLI